MVQPSSTDAGKEPLYCWLIAFACFWLSFLTVGLHRSAGIIYVSVVNVFDISREQAIWPFSLCGSIMCLLGPLAGFLTHYFTIRAILVCGILVSAVAVAVCFFTPSLLYLVIFFGALRGIGNGLVVTLNPVLINQHFKRRKATATGIAYAGASVGSFALPPLIEYLLATYGFKGCFLLLGAIVLNGLIPACLARQPPTPRATRNPHSNGSIRGSSSSPETGDTATQNAIKNGILSHKSLPDVAETAEPLLKRSEENNKSEVILIPNSSIGHEDPMVWYNNEVNLKCQVASNGLSLSKKDYKLLADGQTDAEIADHAPSSVPGGTMSLLKKMQQREDGVFGHFRHTAQILTNPMYIVICATFGCNVVNFLSYLTVIVDFALDRGVGEADAVFLVSAFSVGDLFGAICLGWLSDMRFLKRKYTVTLAFAVMGSLLVVLPLCWTHALMLTVSVCMGLLNGCVMTNMPVIMRDYLGLERLAVAVGLGHFLVGVGQLLLPLLIGYFRDNVGAYDHLFHTLGAMCFICAVCWMFEPLLSRFK